jgi:hypothetical protein
MNSDVVDIGGCLLGAGDGLAALGLADESSTNKQHHLSAENKLSTDNSKRRLKLAWWEQRTQWHYRHWKQLKKDLNFFGQWALCAAELTLARAGGGEDKKASCRDSMTLC